MHILKYRRSVAGYFPPHNDCIYSHSLDTNCNRLQNDKFNFNFFFRQFFTVLISKAQPTCTPATALNIDGFIGVHYNS